MNSKKITERFKSKMSSEEKKKLVMAYCIYSALENKGV